MSHASALRACSRTGFNDAPDVGEDLEAGRTLLEELKRAKQASARVNSGVPRPGGETSPSEPLETMFLESCDITEVDAPFEDIPVELPVVDITRVGSLEQKASVIPSRGGPDTVAKLPSSVGSSEPIFVPSSRPIIPFPRPACQLPPKSCTDCHHRNTPLTVRQKRFQYLQTMCGSPSPVLPGLLNVSEPLSERCDWKIRGGTVGDWRKCPKRPPPAFEQHFNGSKFRLLETRRRDLDRTLRARAAKQIGVPIHMYVRNTPFFEWPTPPHMDW